MSWSSSSSFIAFPLPHAIIFQVFGHTQAMISLETELLLLHLGNLNRISSASLVSSKWFPPKKCPQGYTLVN